jgi:Ser/Thr protein kinase RdoA (MazF antagonist)
MPREASPFDSATIAEDLQAAARAYFRDATALDPIDGYPDMVRVTAPSGLWRIRRWPEATLPSEIAFSHEIMTVARVAGLSIVPAVAEAPGEAESSALRLGDRLYDAQEWLPGHPPPRGEVTWPEPDDRIELPVPLSAANLADVSAALAHLHEATAHFAARKGIPTAPLDMLPDAVRQAQSRYLGVLRASARREPAIQRWLATGERLVAAATPVVHGATRDDSLPTSILHLGLWPARVLLLDNSVSGLIGWEHVAAGSPLLDLAQATLRLHGWSVDAVEEAVGAYSAIRPLAPEERRLFPAVAALDAVATTGRLLEQTYAVHETARPPTALRAAIDMMLRSMTALDRNLNAPPPGAKRRTWVHRAPHPAARRDGGKPRDRRR